jgi:hypothetical protein
MAKLKITKTYTNPDSTTTMVDRYTMPTQIPTGTYVGGTGGFTAQTGRQIQPTVKAGGASATTGSIIRQKGAHKFQVSDENTVADESVTIGQTYRINSVGSTDWAAMGAGPNANTNEVFTATAVGAGSGTVQNVAECTLVNLVTPTAANTMSILCTAANVSNANIANIGANVSGNRTTAYITWNSGDVVGGTANFKVGQTINLINSNVTGTVTISTINSTSNLTVTLGSTQTVPVGNTSAITATFMASKISNKYVWDFLNGGTAESSSTGGFTGANNPNRYRYHLAAPTDTFVQVAYA